MSQYSASITDQSKAAASQKAHVYINTEAVVQCAHLTQLKRAMAVADAVSQQASVELPEEGWSIFVKDIVGHISIKEFWC